MIRRVKQKMADALNLNAPSKTQPFDEILFSRTGSRHRTGVFEEADSYRWERGRVSEITSFTYNNLNKTPLSISVTVATEDGEKDMQLMSSDLHYLAPYVPATSVDGLEGCVIPVFYTVGEDDCYLSAENGYLVTRIEDFATPPSEAIVENV